MYFEFFDYVQMMILWNIKHLRFLEVEKCASWCQTKVEGRRTRKTVVKG